MSKKNHWRTLTNKSYLVGELLDGKETTLTIKRVTKEEIQNQKGKEIKPVIVFEETELKMVVNVTNLKSISKVLGTPFIDEWIGGKITLVPTKGRWFGEDQVALRIKMDYSNIKINR